MAYDNELICQLVNASFDNVSMCGGLEWFDNLTRAIYELNVP